jgi:hypothetical protein
VLFFFPQSLQQSLIGPVNGVVFGALPIVLMHWFVRFMGGAPSTASSSDEHRDFATHAAPSM